MLLNDSETTQIRFHNGKFLETMAVTKFEGDFDEIIEAAKKSDSGLFKVATVDTLNKQKINDLLENNVDLVCLSDKVRVSENYETFSVFSCSCWTP